MIFLNSASSAAALVFYLPGVCTHTDTEGKQIKARVRNISKSSEKNTIFDVTPCCSEIKLLVDLRIPFFLLILYWVSDDHAQSTA